MILSRICELVRALRMSIKLNLTAALQEGNDLQSVDHVVHINVSYADMKILLI